MIISTKAVNVAHELASAMLGTNYLNWSVNLKPCERDVGVLSSGTFALVFVGPCECRSVVADPEITTCGCRFLDQQNEDETEETALVLSRVLIKTLRIRETHGQVSVLKGYEIRVDDTCGHSDWRAIRHDDDIMDWVGIEGERFERDRESVFVDPQQYGDDSPHFDGETSARVCLALSESMLAAPNFWSR